MKTLIVDPRARLGNSIAKTLNEQFIPSLWEPQIAVAERRALSGEFCVIIVTHDLPLTDGLEATQRLRTNGVKAPILVLARQKSPALTARAFELGADEVVERPFVIDDFVARVRKFMLKSALQAHDILAYGAVRLDLTAKRAFVEDAEVRLTPRELMLLQALLLHHGQVLSRSQIISKVWGTLETPYANVVDVQILRLRNALGKTGRELIHTVHGFGYRLGE